jgi:hypothetical protein
MRPDCAAVVSGPSAEPAWRIVAYPSCAISAGARRRRTGTRPMFPLASFSERAGYYFRFYRTYAVDSWDALSPMQYGCLLIGIGLFGWILMKNAVGR